MTANSTRGVNANVARIIMAAVIIAGVMFAPVPFPFKVPLFALVAVAFVRWDSGSFASIGLGRPNSATSTVLWAVAAAVITIAVIGNIIAPAIERALGIEADYSGYGALKGNLSAALQLIGYAMFSAAIAEEIIFRGFLLYVFEKLFGSSRFALAGSVLLAAALFAIPHHGQGISGIAIVFLTGALMGAVYLRSGRNLYAVMLAHAIVDIWGVTGLYLGNI